MTYCIQSTGVAHKVVLRRRSKAVRAGCREFVCDVPHNLSVRPENCAPLLCNINGPAIEIVGDFDSAWAVS